MVTQFLVARKAKKISQKDMARYLGITQCYYSLIEQGKKIPSTNLLIKILDILEIRNVDLRELYKNIGG